MFYLIGREFIIHPSYIPIKKKFGSRLSKFWDADMITSLDNMNLLRKIDKICTLSVLEF